MPGLHGPIKIHYVDRSKLERLAAHSQAYGPVLYSDLGNDEQVQEELRKCDVLEAYAVACEMRLPFQHTGTCFSIYYFTPEIGYDQH